MHDDRQNCWERFLINQRAPRRQNYGWRIAEGFVHLTRPMAIAGGAVTLSTHIAHCSHGRDLGLAVKR
jgi:hypothetical protein